MKPRHRGLRNYCKKSGDPGRLLILSGSGRIAWKQFYESGKNELDALGGERIKKAELPGRKKIVQKGGSLARKRYGN